MVSAHQCNSTLMCNKWEYQGSKMEHQHNAKISLFHPKPNRMQLCYPPNNNSNNTMVPLHIPHKTRCHKQDHQRSIHNSKYSIRATTIHCVNIPKSLLYRISLFHHLKLNRMQLCYPPNNNNKY